MLKQFMRGFVLLLIMTVLTGILYPLVVTGLAQLIFTRQANGSLIVQKGQIMGSELIGQNFTDPKYFHGRPSAAGSNGYDPTASGGSNLGPTNPLFLDVVGKRLTTIRRENGLASEAKVPADLVTASASGLDPEISPEAALIQVPRIAKVRNLSEQELKAYVENHIEQRQLGVFGEPRINVLMLNLALDQGLVRR